MNWMVPPEYVVLDIETIAGDPTEADEWMRRAWSPSPKWKPGTIGSRFLDAYEKKQEQLALLDTAPIISVTIHTATDCRVIHWLPCEEPAIAELLRTYRGPLKYHEMQRITVGSPMSSCLAISDEGGIRNDQ